MKKKFVIQKEGSREGLIAAVAGYIRSWPEGGKPGLIEIGVLKRERTSQQNRALFGHAYPIIMEDTGHEVNEVHEIMCGYFFGTRVVNGLGQTKKKPIRTTTRDPDGNRDVMKTDEFVKFFDFVQHKAAEFGILVPDPDPDWREHMAEQAAKEKAAEEKTKQVEK